MDIPAFFNGVTWEAVPPSGKDSEGLPFVTHQGVFELLGHRLRCFRLSNGQAVFEQEDFEKLLCETLLSEAAPPATPGIADYCGECLDIAWCDDNNRCKRRSAAAPGEAKEAK